MIFMVHTIVSIDHRFNMPSADAYVYPAKGRDSDSGEMSALLLLSEFESEDGFIRPDFRSPASVAIDVNTNSRQRCIQCLRNVNLQISSTFQAHRKADQRAVLQVGGPAIAHASQ